MNLNQTSKRSGGGYYVLGELHTGLTVQGLMELYMADAEKRLAPASFHAQEQRISRHILPALGDVEIDYLTTEDVEDFLRRLLESGRLSGKGGLSKKTVADIRCVLNSAFKLVCWEVEDPGVFIDAPHLKPLNEIMTLRQADTLTRLTWLPLTACR